MELILALPGNWTWSSWVKGESDDHYTIGAQIYGWQIFYIPHCIFTILNHQRISFPVLRGIHRNQYWKEFLKSCESFLRKSQFCTLTDLNPGFGVHWDMLEIFLINDSFIMLQMKSFGQIFFLNFMYGLKSAILAIFQFWQNGTFEPVHEIQNIFWLKDFFWSIMKMSFKKNIYNMSQGPPNPGFRSVRVQNWDFFKKDSQDFKNSFQYGFLWIPCKTGKHN